MEEDIQSDDHNIVDKEQYALIQENHKDIEIPGKNTTSDTKSTYSNLRRSYRESHPAEILEHTINRQLYMQALKVKKIDEHIIMELTIRFCMKQTKTVHKKITLTT